jgi:hypothetical protein
MPEARIYVLDETPALKAEFGVQSQIFVIVIHDIKHIDDRQEKHSQPERPAHVHLEEICP